VSFSVCIVETLRQRDDAFAVRIAVFVEEQQIPRREELDELDDTATHAVGYLDVTPVAAGRLVLAGGYAKIGRMAVLRDHRGHGYGARILEALESEARAHGVVQIRLSAQLHAAPFYERAGYVGEGDVYAEVGIPHVAMVKALT
jgi:predicted GNAT family N-acyltransferase